MKRWTVRNIEPEAIKIIQDVANSTGASLGEAISLAIELGAAAAQAELQVRYEEEDPAMILRRIQVLQNSMAEILRDVLGQTVSRRDVGSSSATGIHQRSADDVQNS
jgi:hypothetical protein